MKQKDFVRVIRTVFRTFDLCVSPVRKALFITFAALLMGFVSSCTEDEDEPLGTLTVTLASDETVGDYTLFSVTATELKSGKDYTQAASAAGKTVFTLPLGAYNIVVEDKIDGTSSMYGALQNVTLGAAGASVEVRLTKISTSLEKSFVLNELYFNGDSNGDWDYIYYESYLTITNVSDQTLYADGLSIAICGDYNSVASDGNDPMPQYLKRDSVVITQLYTIPGKGRTYKVEPGASLVLAHSAINHKLDADGREDAAKPNSIDLSGADFEFYVPYEYAMTTDNPEVPNMIVDYAMNQAFNWGYNGQTPIMLVHLNNADKERVLRNKVNLAIPYGYSSMMLDHLVLPASCIIDGVETGGVDNMVRKVLPTNIDRGSVLVNSFMGFDGQFVRRKQTTSGGKTTVIDTNNSSDDFEIVAHGQKSYPAK